jgi:Flp pilus assembly protein TadG
MIFPSVSSIDVTSHRVRLRRAQRGAAMVEAAFMFPMFVILWFSIVYAHSFSSTQIDANTQSRELAWTDAMANCNTKGYQEKETLPQNNDSLSVTRNTWTSTSATTSIAVSTNETASKLSATPSSSNASDAMSAAVSGGSLEGAFGSLIGPVLNAIASILPSPQGAKAVATGPVSWRMPNTYAGLDPSNSTTMKQTTTVTCNIAPINGGLSGLFDEIKGAVSGP